jgi:DNA-binding response OmpR family regulator
VSPDAPPRVLILADDLIWSTRLVGLIRGAGARAVSVATAVAFERALVDADRVLIDLTARGYDGLAAVKRAAGAGLPVLCVGQHDDHVLRRAVLAAGASRVYAYRKLFEDGPATIAAWLGTSEAPTSGADL